MSYERGAKPPIVRKDVGGFMIVTAAKGSPSDIQFLVTKVDNCPRLCDNQSRVYKSVFSVTKVDNCPQSSWREKKYCL